MYFNSWEKIKAKEGLEAQKWKFEQRNYYPKESIIYPIQFFLNVLYRGQLQSKVSVS